ncbi:leucine--tRNA ligase [Candidatus Uhrbacteria bacterium]|nr:leucine--tRNA ligase [Candidatus Uhrbacteria bacterium]
MNYDHKKIEKKWQQRWDEQGLFAAKNNDTRKKFYALIEFPYPSGEGLHVGHPRSYTAMDIIARKRRMEGYNVLYPIGFDSFGLPTENYAIKTGRPPAEITKENIANFTRQLKRLGFSFDWERAVTTSDPSYYRWTQWIFLQFYKHGLAYKAKMPINWCPSCKIGLANEEVVNGGCERCGAPVEEREREQWMLAITKYADKLLDGLKEVDYIERAKVQQQHWIGRSEGVNYRQTIKDLNITVEAYDSVPQTFMAQTFAVIAPEHPLVQRMIEGTEYEKPVRAFVERIIKKKRAGKLDLEKEMEGIFTGRYVENPFGTGDLPIWVASFVVADYGTGFVNCSACDERDFAFAKKYNIPLHPVMFPQDPVEAEKIRNLEYCYHHDENGILTEPIEFKGRKWGEIRRDIIKYIEQQGFGYRKVQYKLRDWVFSRQRYWGEPIPLVYCDACVAWVPIPEDQLPLELPKVEKYQPTDTGESPLAAMHDWVQTTCPKCGGPARRETDTMPNWAGSSWYFLRYCDPKNKKEFASKKALQYWTPVDWYNGGMEHTVLHLLYSRFWNQFLYDIGVVPTREPYTKRTSHGLIMAEDGEKMSKSRGNVVNPDAVVEQVGADTLRLYEMFMGPFDQAVPWSTDGIMGVRRFVEKVWRLFHEITESQNHRIILGRLLHKTVKKVTEDIEAMKYNTAISAMMIFVNEAHATGLSKEQAEAFLKILAPFAPHIAEELWEQLGHAESISREPWPTFDSALCVDEEIELVIQVNGRVRDRLRVAADIPEADAKAQALEREKVKPWIAGKKIEKVVFVQGRLVNIVVT